MGITLSTLTSTQINGLKIALEQSIYTTVATSLGTAATDLNVTVTSLVQTSTSRRSLLTPTVFAAYTVVVNNPSARASATAIATVVSSPAALASIVSNVGSATGVAITVPVPVVVIASPTAMPTAATAAPSVAPTAPFITSVPNEPLGTSCLLRSVCRVVFLL